MLWNCKWHYGAIYRAHTHTHTVAQNVIAYWRCDGQCQCYIVLLLLLRGALLTRATAHFGAMWNAQTRVYGWTILLWEYRLLSMSVPTSIYNISSPYQTHINLKFRFSMVFFLSVCLFVWCLQTRTPHLADWRTMRYRTRRFWTSHSNHRLPYMHSTALWAIIWDCTHWDIRGEAPLASGIWQWKLYVL